jgi:hypothetical protein
MKKLSLAMAVLAAAVVAAGSVTSYKASSHTNRQTVPATIQADFPIPTCPPDCHLNVSSPAPDPLPN